MDSIYFATALAIITFFIWHFWNGKNKNIDSRKQAPEPKGRCPIIGHMLLLKGDATHRTLGELADRYGPAITIHIGSHPVLVISSWELAKECFTINDRAFASRPHFISGEHIGFNFAGLGFAPMGPYWREARKIVVHQLLSKRRLESLQHVWVNEVDLCIRELYALCMSGSAAVDMTKRFWDLSFNIFTGMVTGKRYFGDGKTDAEAQRFQRLVGKVVCLLGAPDPGQFIPFLKWFDVLGIGRALKGAAKEFDSIIKNWMEAHNNKENGEGTRGGDRYLLDVLLALGQEGRLPDQHPVETFIKANIFLLIAAGTDSTSSELVWALSSLINNRHVLRKAQSELDVQVGPNRMVQILDLGKLTYLQAIIKETLRLYPAGPLLVPHESIEDCQVGGFHVRSGTHLFVNVWKMHRDPRVWSDPLEFRPERFLESQVDVWGQHFEFLPFGSGRRSCAGSSLAVQILQLALAGLLHSFEWATPLDAPVDMAEGLGFGLPKLKPLQLLAAPRLNPTLYE